MSLTSWLAADYASDGEILGIFTPEEETKKTSAKTEDKAFSCRADKALEELSEAGEKLVNNLKEFRECQKRIAEENALLQARRRTTDIRVLVGLPAGMSFGK